MAINGVTNSKLIDFYSKTNKNLREKKQTEQAKDSVEISSLGKSLSAYSLDDSYSVSKAGIEEIKNRVQNGTYSVNAKLVAQKIYDNFKGKGV